MRLPSQIHPRHAGFTAFEALLAVAILAIITAAVSGALSAGRQQSQNSVDLLYARMHAEALMSEVLRLAPSTNTSKSAPTAGITRQSAADLQDYCNYSDGPAGIKDLSGNAYPDAMQGFVRTISVTRQGTMKLKNMTLSAPCVVTVTISHDGRVLVNQSRLVPG